MQFSKALLTLLAAAPAATTAFVVPHSARTSTQLHIQSENSKRTSGGRSNGGDFYNQGGGGGQDYDYSGGNLKYGTGKYTQRENDGYQGGVNISQNGRSMQDGVYREDRQNVERARGRPRYGRMDELEDLERGLYGGGGDRMMRGNRRENEEREMFEMEEFGEGARERMGGGGLLRDLQGGGGRHREGGFDEGYPTRGGKVMGGSSHGRGGGYRSSQFQSGLSNERRRYEEFGFRHHDDGDFDDMMMEGGGRRSSRGGRNGSSNFDRRREGGGYEDEHFLDDQYNNNHMMEAWRQPQGSRGMGGGSMNGGSMGRRNNGGRMGGRDRHFEEFGDDRYGRDGGREGYGGYDEYGGMEGRGSGGLLRDNMRR